MTKPERAPWVTRQDIEDLAVDLGPGKYVGVDLYRRHTELIEAEGRKPVHPIAFGQMLRAAGAQPKKVQRDGKSVRAWLL
jgi:hypothetical protein